MQTRSARARVVPVLTIATLMLVGPVGVGWADDDDDDGHAGLNRRAKRELAETGLNQYVGQFEPAVGPEDVGGGWDRYTFDTEGGDGPICISGFPLTVFHQERDPRKLLIVLDGGGACAQDFYACSPFADEDAPTGGIFDDGFDGIENPFASWSKVFVSYCDGSVFSGDNEVEDPDYPFGDVRYHRGVRNLTAALDLAHDLNLRAKKVLLSGISAGGYGVATYAPSVYRFVFPKSAKLFVLNDSGPSISNLVIPFDEAWQASQFFPESCTECSTLPDGDGAFVEWTLENDRGYKGSLYSTDGDEVIRSFTFIPTQEQYRERLLGVQDPLNAGFPDRYRRFIRSGSEAHTALGFAGFYLFEADGVPLYEWVEAFVEENDDDDDDDDDDDGGDVWVDIVEDFVPAP